jgi:hypothetical protein
MQRRKPLQQTYDPEKTGSNSAKRNYYKQSKNAIKAVAHKKDQNDSTKLQAHRDSRSTLRREIKSAKTKWLNHFARHVSTKGFKLSPKEAWQSVNTIKASFFAHHKKPAMNIRMKLPSGQLATNDNKNAEVLVPHFNEIFNAKNLILI